MRVGRSEISPPVGPCFMTQFREEGSYAPKLCRDFALGDPWYDRACPRTEPSRPRVVQIIVGYVAIDVTHVLLIALVTLCMLTMPIIGSQSAEASGFGRLLEPQRTALIHLHFHKIVNRTELRFHNSRLCFGLR